MSNFTNDDHNLPTLALLFTALGAEQSGDELLIEGGEKHAVNGLETHDFGLDDDQLLDRVVPMVNPADGSMIVVVRPRNPAPQATPRPALSYVGAPGLRLLAPQI